MERRWLKVQLGLVGIVWLPVPGRGANLCSPLKCSLGIQRWDSPIPTLQKKIPSASPVQDAAVTPASQPGRDLCLLEVSAPACPSTDVRSWTSTWRSLFFSWTGSVSWFSPNKMTCCFQMRLSVKFFSSFRKLEDLFFNPISNSDSLTSYSFKCKTKHYDIFLPSVGCRSNFRQTSCYFYLVIHSHIIQETKMGRSCERCGP